MVRDTTSWVASQAKYVRIDEPALSNFAEKLVSETLCVTVGVSSLRARGGYPSPRPPNAPKRRKQLQAIRTSRSARQKEQYVFIVLP